METDLALRRQDPEACALEAAEGAVLRCRAGRFGDGLALLVSALGPVAHTPLVEACTTVLELCAKSGEPHHVACAKIYSALREWELVDSRAANSNFQMALRGGHMPAAMRAAKHAEEANLKLSPLMQSTLRQVRRYKRSSGAS